MLWMGCLSSRVGTREPPGSLTLWVKGQRIHGAGFLGHKVS